MNYAQDHIFLDIGTSTLNHETGEILNIAAIRTDRNGRHIQAFYSKVLPSGEVEIGKGKGNEYQKDFWIGAPKQKSVLDSFRAVLLNQYDSRFIVVTHHADFVRPFVKDFGEKFEGRAWIDTAQLAWPLLINGMISSRALEVLTRHFDITTNKEESQTIVGGCTAIMQVYWEIMRRYKTALTGEEMIRNTGGDTLAHVRRWFGF